MIHSEITARHFAGIVIAIFLSLSGGCRSTLPDSQSHTQLTTSSRTLVRTELFFGLSRPGGADLSVDEFDGFLREEVTNRFPSGFTVIPSQGQWREQDGRIRTEPSRILIIIHSKGADIERNIELIRNAYKTRFNQEAVLRTDYLQSVSF